MYNIPLQRLLFIVLCTLLLQCSPGFPEGVTPLTLLERVTFGVTFDAPPQGNRQGKSVACQLLTLGAFGED